MSFVAQNIDSIRNEINTACSKIDKNPEEIIMVGVTKTIPTDLILEALNHGLKIFGESRIQEAKIKKPDLPSQVTWHMIGHLQTNKIHETVDIFKMVQSIDSLRLAALLSQAASRVERKIDVLIEVNISREPAKYGFLEEEVEDAYKEMGDFEGLNIQGLMAIAPYFESPEDTRPYFRKMRILFDKMNKLKVLSMGMSHDFRIAVEEGSTMVRIGQAIFKRS